MKTKYKICEEKSGSYHIELKNKLGFWCKYRRIPFWSPPPGTPLVVEFSSYSDAERAVTLLQNGKLCNEGPSMVMIGVIVTLVVTVITLGAITTLQSGV